jgi:phage tail sheath protein FI
MSYNIGLTVLEVNGTGAPAIAGAATSVAGFNIITRRGIPNSPARISSFADFTERFGSHFPGGLGSYLVRGFFDNSGAVAYVNRVAGAASTVASLQLMDSAPAATLRLEGGYRGTADPGSWGRSLYARTTRRSVTTGRRLEETGPASVTTAAALPQPIDMTAAGFPSLAVTIDGAAAPTVITFRAAQFVNPAAATRQEILNAINGGTDDLAASLEPGNELTLTSTGNIAMLSGGFTSLSVAANATLGFPGVATDTATTSPLGAGGATFQDVSGLKAGDAAEFTDGATTERVKIQSVNALTRAVTWVPSLAAPGAYVATDLRVSTLEFDLTIYQDGPAAANLVETHLGLSMESDVANYAVAKLNDPRTGSVYARAVDEGSASTLGLDRPVDLAAPAQFNAGGVDAAPSAPEFIGSSATRTGFHAFSPYAIQLLTCERTDPSLASAGIAYCEERDDCMYVGAVPESSISGRTAVAYGQALQGQKRFGALYGPWVIVSDPIGPGDNPFKLVPPTGHVMGVFARIERARGVWKAPAGDEAQLRGVIDVATHFSDTDHTDLVKNGGVNGIRAVPRAGIIIDSSRTLSTDSRWLYVNVRLLFNYVKSGLRVGLRWVRQEPNRDQLWNLVKYGSVTPFLTQLWSQGAFGTGAPSEVFTVICDASNNPPAQVQLGYLNVEIYFYPTVPAETIVVKVGQQPSGAKTSDS